MDMGHLIKALYSETVVGFIERRRQKLVDGIKRKRGKVQDVSQEPNNMNGIAQQPRNQQPDFEDRHFRY